MEATMTKAQMKEEAIRKAAAAAAEKKALDAAKKAAKKAKASGGAVTEQREKAAEALARKQQEREEREKREAEEAYARSPEGRAALKAKRDKEQELNRQFNEKSERYNMRVYNYDKKHQIVYDITGNPLTPMESAWVRNGVTDWGVY
jgi:hypothetical protein